MKPEEPKAAYAEPAEELGQRTGRSDALRVASGLAAGMTHLRRSLYLRLHEDVERIVGRDSILMPVSEKKSELLTATEIELFQIAESTASARDRGYVHAVEDWYVDWLIRLRLGQPPVEPRAGQRVTEYLAKTPDGRRLAFSTVLARVLPEARRAPLVLFQLFPLAVHIVTALAFGDNKAASAARSQQIALLPGIGDCRECRGRVLESGEQCPACGNPLWKSEWLTEMD